MYYGQIFQLLFKSNMCFWLFIFVSVSSSVDPKKSTGPRECWRRSTCRTSSMTMYPTLPMITSPAHSKQTSCTSRCHVNPLSIVYMNSFPCQLSKKETSRGNTRHFPCPHEQIDLSRWKCACVDDALVSYWIIHLYIPKEQLQPFHYQEWSTSKFPCSLTRNITSHSMENLTFQSVLRWKMIILPIFTTWLIYFSING